MQKKPVGPRMKHPRASYSSTPFQNVSDSGIDLIDPKLSLEFKQNIEIDCHARQGIDINSFGQCCNLPAVLDGGSASSCSFAYCKHCVYSGEADVLKRAHGIGSCVWHLHGVAHKGMFQVGIPCGWGTRTWDDGVVQQGFWKGHKLNGRGLIHFVDGSSYHGMLVDSIRTGQGIYLSTSGYSYEGWWQHDKPHGLGKSSDDCRGIKYSGEWECGLMHGHGMMTNMALNGTTRRYEGSFARGKREGHGVEELGDNISRYCGDWKQNLRHGIGLESVSGQGIYVGEWKNDLRHGNGVFKSSRPNKSHSEGEWENGLRHGRAIVRWDSGDSFACVFTKGKMVGPGLLRKSSTSTDNRQGATLLVQSDTIHTTRNGARASALRSGSFHSTSLFLLPASKIHSKTREYSVA